MSGLVSFSGLSSGLDTASIVSALVNAARGPINRLQTERSNLNAQKGVFNNIKNLVANLKSAAQSLDTSKEFFAYSAASSNTDGIVVAAGGNATPGTFAVTVQQLAAAQRTYSQTYASKTDPIFGGNQTLQITVGSATAVTVNLTDSMSLESVVEAINGSGAAVTAGILFDGTNYRLQVASRSTGLANAISFGGAGATSLGLDVPGNTVQVAQNAQLSVDGYTISRSSNVIDDVLTGVTLNLKSVNAQPVSVTVAADAAAVRTQINSFIAAYNAVVTKVAENFQYSGAPEPKKPFGDSTLRGLQLQLSRSATAAIEGLTGKYTALAEVGIRTEASGTLRLDNAAFDKAFADDPYAVSRLFASDTALGTVGVAERIQNLGKVYGDGTDGRLSARLKGYDSRVAAVDDSIARMETRVSAYEAQMKAQFAALEQMMTALQSQNSAIAAFSASF